MQVMLNFLKCVVYAHQCLTFPIAASTENSQTMNEKLHAF